MAVERINFLYPLYTSNDFKTIFEDLGYSVVFASNFYSVKDPSDAQTKLNSLFSLAAKHESTYNKTPKLWIDIRGFRLNSQDRDKILAILKDNEKYIFALHVIDEPDAHQTGDPKVVKMTAKQMGDLLKQALAGNKNYRLAVTFENQFGLVNNRRWNYKYNDDAFYLAYLETMKTYSNPPPCVGVDYYQFSRSRIGVPPDQAIKAEMMEKGASLYWSMGYDALVPGYVFSWTETVNQDLPYMRKYPKAKVDPKHLFAQNMINWASGQTGARGDFNFIGTSNYHGAFDDPRIVETLKIMNDVEDSIADYIIWPALPLINVTMLGSVMMKKVTFASLRIDYLSLVDPSKKPKVLLIAVNSLTDGTEERTLNIYLPGLIGYVFKVGKALREEVLKVDVVSNKSTLLTSKGLPNKKMVKNSKGDYSLSFDLKGNEAALLEIEL